MNTIPPFDAELLRRYDKPGPRYTSYPTAPQFHAGFGDSRLPRGRARQQRDPIPRRCRCTRTCPICFSPCFYCGCNRVITRDKARGGAYLARLQREIALVRRCSTATARSCSCTWAAARPISSTPASSAS
jgi:oxygen-independent coproporphyrinogen-3 oxidase